MKATTFFKITFILSFIFLLFSVSFSVLLNPVQKIETYKILHHYYVEDTQSIKLVYKYFSKLDKNGFVHKRNYGHNMYLLLPEINKKYNKNYVFDHNKTYAHLKLKEKYTITQNIFKQTKSKSKIYYEFTY
jgi:ERCC4-related helicase